MMKKLLISLFLFMTFSYSQFVTPANLPFYIGELYYIKMHIDSILVADSSSIYIEGFVIIDTSLVAYLNQNETITGNWINTDNPWADNEVANDITVDNYTLLSAVRDSIDIRIDSTYIDEKNFLPDAQFDTHEASVTIHHTATVSSDISHDLITGVSTSDHHVQTTNTNLDSLGVDALNFVPDLELSTWAGTTNITTLGTIATGVWSGTSIIDAKIDNSITITPINATTETAIEAVVDLQDLQGAVTDGQVPDNITITGLSGTNTGDNIIRDGGTLISSTPTDLDFLGADFVLSDVAKTDSVEISIADSGIDHNATTNFLTAEHVDWASSGTGTVHATNYVDNNTQLDSSGVDALGFIPDAEFTTHKTSTDHDGQYYTETEEDTWRSSVTQTEMGYLNGTTSDIQTQFGNKQASDNALSNISGLVYVSPSFIKLTANDTYVVRTLAETKTDLDLSGTNTGDNSGTDDQKIDVFSISGNNVQLSLESDGEATKTVDISTTTAVTANTAKVTDDDITIQDGGTTISTDANYMSFLSTDFVVAAAVADSVTVAIADGALNDEYIELGDALLTAGTNNVKDTHIDYGTGAGQHSAVDVPIADGGGIITATEIEGALQENRTAIDLNTPKVTMTYPSAGIALSTGSAWSASITNNSANWNTAYTDRLKWDGGATDLVAATGRTSLGGTTIGQNIFIKTNPSAITFGRANADNTFDLLSATNFRTAIGVDVAGTDNSTDVTIGTANGLSLSTQVLSMALSNGSVTGTLNSTNWNTFNNKVDIGDAVTIFDGTAWRGLYLNATGDVTEFVLGANGTFLESNGANAAPAYRALETGDIPDLSGTYQPLDGALSNISGLVYVSPSFIKLTANDTYAVRTLSETKTDLDLSGTNTGDDSGTDDQKIDVFSGSGNTISISLEADGEADKTLDISGFTAIAANTLKPTNADLQNSLVGNYYNFDGGDDRIIIVDADAFDFGTEDFSFSIRMKRYDAYNDYDAYLSQNSGSNDFGFYTSNAGFRLAFGGTQDALFTSLSSASNVGDWEHITITVDRGGDIIAYLNGVAKDVVGVTVSEATSIDLTGMTIGWFWGGYGYSDISTVQFFNRALTETEVQEISKWDSDNPPIWFSDVGANQTELTSGTLTIGKRYRINDWITNDDFTNIGGTNEDGNEFIATGTTPTTWTNSSIVVPIGAVANYNSQGMTASTWHDNSGNDLDGTITGATVVRNTDVGFDNLFVDGKISAATYGSDGSVTDVELLYINTLSGNVQTQFAGKQPLEATLTDIADGTINENLINTANPWAANEIVSTVIHESELSALETDPNVDTANEIEAILTNDNMDFGTGIVTANKFVSDTTSMPAFSVRQVAGGQAISDVTSTKLDWATEDWDTHADFNLTDEKFTPSIAGYYFITAGLMLKAGTMDAGDWFILSVKKNNVDITGGYNIQKFESTSEFYHATVNMLVYLNGTTDYVDAAVYGNLGVAFNTYDNNNYRYTYFQGYGIL